MNELGKPFRKNQTNKKTSIAGKQILVITTFSHSTLKIQQKKTSRSKTTCFMLFRLSRESLQSDFKNHEKV